MVRKRRHKLWKIQQLLGEKEELDNQYLMRQFPVIQRLQFTKWPASQLFVFSVLPNPATLVRIFSVVFTI